ncbi:hypothetical protein HPB50_010149 [Hyalomma asiaticum]|uniref:Uncharacterized protein n=1 Tax=Hyalomma asiaticum TaxID=266040 RepID=A0ACB7T1U7_HYAAI|nr:hypothetical protein HPB50_010149 [Hyalomma asiaticum]
MRPQGSKVANFENLDLRELRVTPASLRLRRVIIGASIAYILVFTPVMGYFIWNYMMAAPDLSRHRHADTVESAKSCSNRRMPSFHFALNRAGRHGQNGSTLSHANDSHHDLPPSGRQLESVANTLRDRNHQVSAWTPAQTGRGLTSSTFGNAPYRNAVRDLTAFACSRYSGIV